jgi:hypothetical protein
MDEPNLRRNELHTATPTWISRKRIQNLQHDSNLYTNFTFWKLITCISSQYYIQKVNENGLNSEKASYFQHRIPCLLFEKNKLPSHLKKPNTEYTLKACNCKCYVVVPYIFVYFKGRSTLQMSDKMVLRTTFRRTTKEDMLDRKKKLKGKGHLECIIYLILLE